MINIKLKKIKEIEKNTYKINIKDVKYFFIYCLSISVLLSFIVKNIFLIPFSFIFTSIFSAIYCYFINKKYMKNKQELIKKIKEIENSEESLFKLLFNKEDNFELMKELLSSNKIDKDEVEDLYINLSKKKYEELNIKNYIDTYECLLSLLKIKEKKDILSDIEDHIEEGIRKPFIKKINKVKELFKKKEKKKRKIIIKKL